MSTPANLLRNPYFGELHVHTAWSLDAFVIAALNGPDEAFRYAKGEPARSSMNNTEVSHLSRPLDFAAVTEHSEWLGEYGLLVDPDYHPEDPEGRERVDRYRSSRVPGDDGRAGHIQDTVEVVISGMVRPDPTRLNLGAPEKEVLEAARTIWRRIVQIAESHNDPGRFTTLNGFEWTPTPGGVNLHRVIIFRGNDVPELPLSNYETGHPEQLWDWLETAAGGPDNALAITHNANFSNGQMFNPATATAGKSTRPTPAAGRCGSRSRRCSRARAVPRPHRRCHPTMPSRTSRSSRPRCSRSSPALPPEPTP